MAVNKIPAIRHNLIRWFKEEARDLPWRRTKDPYQIWLSEIMLQQTRVETVIPYYHKFLKKFPTVLHLAKAKEDEMLKVWEGLGYYRRAHNMYRTAKIIANEYHGIFPESFELWKKLPGIGAYTAGAITSIAFGVKAAAIDGNAKRVYARLFAVEEPIDNTSVEKEIHNIAQSLLPKNEPGAFNQAIMELGARICLPKNPLCDQCPVRKHCAANLHQRQNQIPLRTPKKTVPHRIVVAGAIRKNGRYLLGKRPRGGMLEGLWEFPGGKVEENETHEQALIRELEEELGIQVEVNELIASVNHGYTHLRVTIYLYSCSISAGKPTPIYHSEIKWIPRSQFERYAFPAANLKFFSKL